MTRPLGSISSTRPLATVLAIALAAVAAPLHGAFAEEAPKPAAATIETPGTDESEPAPDAMAPMTQGGSPTTAPVEPTTPAPPPVSSEPIEAVSRPRGAWGPVAIAADLLVMRPIGLVSLAAGGAAFVVVSPVALATGTVGDRVDALRDRAANVFTRPLGAL